MLAQAVAFQQLSGTIIPPLAEQDVEQIHASFSVRRQTSTNDDEGLKAKPRAESPSRFLRPPKSDALHPIRRYATSEAHQKRLPVELWQCIFQYACAGLHPFHEPPIGRPVLLSRVCSSWRSIITNMPELWTSLHFYDREEGIRTPLQKLQAARTYFSRARGLPLSFTLTETSNTLLPINFIQGVIISFSQSFRFLHLVLPISQLQELLLLPNGSLDALEELHIAPSTEKRSLSFPTWTHRVTVFGRTSRLRRLRFQLSAILNPHLLDLPWQNIQTFRCDSSLECQDCHTLLLACKSLRQLHIRICNIRYASQNMFEINLPNLTNLNLHLCDSELYDYFFLPLVVPSLKSLMIYQYEGLPWSQTMYTCLLERSNCEIEDLYLGTLHADPNDLIRLMALTLSLRSLTISHKTDISPEYLQHISSGTIGGSLQRLVIKGTREVEPLISMLEKLHEPDRTSILYGGSTSSKLCFLETYTAEDVSPFRDRLERLMEAGVYLSLVNEPDGCYQL